MKKSRKKIGIKTYLTPITLITGVIFLVGLILILLVVVFLGRDPVPATGTTPVVTMKSAPTLTLMPPAVTATSSPTPTSIFFLPEGVIGVGAYVQVVDTGGAGLRMRADPGLQSTVNFTAMESEVFLVIDGPVEADAYTWWHLEAPYDQTRNGWSAGDFLVPIEAESE